MWVQGARDPLNDALQRASDIAAACPNVRVQLLDGGHWRAPRPNSAHEQHTSTHAWAHAQAHLSHFCALDGFAGLAGEG